MNDFHLYDPTNFNSYCSKKLRTHFPTIKHFGEGANIISAILRSDVICFHDVIEINHIYQKMISLEKRIAIPQVNSQHVLAEIFRKIEGIKKEIIFKPNALISLYHLQNFSKDELHLKAHFKILNQKFVNDLPFRKEIATLLPFCHTEKQFSTAVKVLVNCPSEEVEMILNQKKEAFKKHQLLQQKILEKKSELKERRKESFYPLYFDYILNNGMIQLYDHLIAMGSFQERSSKRAEIEKLTFYQISLIILQTMELIINKVKDSIPCSYTNILFLLGTTAVGKSTTFSYLRGDELILEDFCYTSKNDKEKLIGQGFASCTFVPNIELVNNFAIVDFPGFNDSHSELISLGMECALKALIKKYEPKVLVLESITNTDGRFAAAAHLGLRLKRLFKNPEDCLLGITKYAKDPHFQNIIKIEKSKSELIESKEISARAAIKDLSELGMDEDEAVQNALKTEQENLKIILKEKAQKNCELSLSDRQKLNENEHALLTQIGMRSFIRFDKLENEDLSLDCFNKFSKAKAIQPNLQQELSSKDQDLLDVLFNTSLINLTKTVEFQKDFEAFDDAVKETSLIATIFSSSHPEIGKFLHLPEMDPQIVQKYDKEIVGDCIQKYMRYFISSLDMHKIKNELEKIKKEAPQDKVVAFEAKLKQARDYILGLRGAECKNDQEADKKWDEIWDEIMQGMQEKESLFSTWLAPMMWGTAKWSAKGSLSVVKNTLEYSAKGAITGLKESIEFVSKQEEEDSNVFVNFMAVFFGTTLTGIYGAAYGVGIGISEVYTDWRTESLIEQEEIKIKQERATHIIESCTNTLEQACDILFRLNDIKNLIAKKEDLERGFNSIPISMTSLRNMHLSLVKRINTVRAIYGADEWDKRVSFLENKFVLTNLSVSFAKEAWLLSYAYLLIEPNLFYDFHRRGLGYWSFVGPKNVNPYFRNKGFKGEGEVRVNERGIEIIVSNSSMPLLQNLEELRKENRLVMRALTAAALLKANDNILKDIT